jgi:hypothetical protein
MSNALFSPYFLILFMMYICMSVEYGVYQSFFCRPIFLKKWLMIVSQLYD